MLLEIAKYQLFPGPLHYNVTRCLSIYVQSWRRHENEIKQKCSYNDHFSAFLLDGRQVLVLLASPQFQGDIRIKFWFYKWMSWHF